MHGSARRGSARQAWQVMELLGGASAGCVVAEQAWRSKAGKVATKRDSAWQAWIGRAWQGRRCVAGVACHGRVGRRDAQQGMAGMGGIVNGYNFTDRVRKVLQMAREEAARLHHEYVGTEHILLGLIREGEGVGAAVLSNLDVDWREIQQQIEETVKKGKAAAGPDLPYTSRAKKVLELAMSEARELNHEYVGTEHLLLGLLREEKGIAAQVLRDAGIDLQKARAETLRLLGAELPTTPLGGGTGALGSVRDYVGPPISFAPEAQLTLTPCPLCKGTGTYTLKRVHLTGNAVAKVAEVVPLIEPTSSANDD